MNLPQLDVIESAIAKLAGKLIAVNDELVPIQLSLGRILAEPLRADRDSPAANVSAMDGYAFRLADLKPIEGNPPRMQVSSIACAGRPPVLLESGKAVQIFTGACVPSGADCIVRREDTIETAGQFELTIPLTALAVGQNIRARGENSKTGQVVLPKGTEITTATIGSVASFGNLSISVRRALKVSILTSGDELVEPGKVVEQWQIRDSNGPTLRSWLSDLRWATLVRQGRIQDDLAGTQQALLAALEVSDVVIVTGGVSAGDTDFIPQAVESLGGEIAFHRLPIRPGKPVLGASRGNKVIFGLPGNPVSTAVTSRVIAQPVMEQLAGRSVRPALSMQLIEPDEKSLSLVWYRLIQLDEAGCRLVDSRGSGDVVSMAQSDGFIQIPAGSRGSGPWKTWLW